MASSGRLAPTKARTRICGTNCCVDLEQALSEKDAGKELDWDTVGNICTKYLEDEVAKVARVDSKYGTEASHARQDSSKREARWEYEHCKHDIMMFRKKLYMGSPLTCWAARGIIDVPLQEVAEFLKRTENNITWDKYLVEATDVKMLSSESNNPRDFIAYLRYEHTSCIVSVNREVLCFVRSQYKGGNFIKVGLSIDDPDYPCSQGVKRMELRLGSGWVLEPYLGSSSKTLVTYVVNSDVKGIPAFVLNQVLKRHFLAINYIKRQLVTPQLASTQDSSDDEEYGQSRIDRKDSAEVELSFEEGLPTSNFIS